MTVHDDDLHPVARVHGAASVARLKLDERVAVKLHSYRARRDLRDLPKAVADFLR